MTKTDAVKYFGKQITLARFIGRAKTTVSEWPEKLPAHIQYELQVRTNGALKADPELQQNRPTGIA